MIEESVEQIKSALEMGFPAFQVDDYPDEFSKFIFTSAKGCILVRYDASSYTNPVTTDTIEQTETMEFSIFFALRYSRKFKDAYKFLETIKDVLTGLLINGSRLYPKKRTYVKRINGDVWWGHTYNLEVTAMQHNYLSDCAFWQNAPVTAERAQQ